jgi:hypothetical protein
MEGTSQNFFEQHGLEVTSGEVEIGKTYPIYGMITNIISDEPGRVLVEINFHIQASMAIPEADKVSLIKERAFEPGIFVSTILEKEGILKVRCSTVVFGKRTGFDA